MVRALFWSMGEFVQEDAPEQNQVLQFSGRWELLNPEIPDIPSLRSQETAVSQTIRAQTSREFAPIRQTNHCYQLELIHIDSLHRDCMPVA